MPLPDRIELLNAPGQNAVAGIDFVYVDPGQTQLDVFFLNDPSTVAPSLVNDLLASQFHIASISGGESLATVPVTAVTWLVIDGRNVARITTASPGDFSWYRLRIEDSRIDPFYNGVRFSFKASCPTAFDCRPRPHDCPSDPQRDYNVNYLARDFWSYRQALLDFASERYPAWRDRLEADAGVMIAELLSALGDEMAFYQDRVGREGYLETATQRRSLRRHARMVDYEIHDGLGATTWLDFQVRFGMSGVIPRGEAVQDRDRKVAFEAGSGLFETTPSFGVDARLNELPAWIWDESAACLSAGSTELWVEADLTTVLPARPDKWVLLRTRPTDPSVAERRWAVHLTAREVSVDPVTGTTVTLLRWDSAQKTPFEMDLETLVVRGNLVPSTSGKTFVRQFRITPSVPAEFPPEAIERAGPGGTVTYLFSLPEAERDIPDFRGDLVWLGADTQHAHPEVRVFEATLVGNTWVEDEEWEWRRSLLGVNSSLATDRHFTLEDGTWRRVVGFRRIGNEIVHRDYASGFGSTLRFGTGQFGLQPAEDTVFQVRYRLGNGVASNVTPDTLIAFDGVALPFVESVSNPLAAINGVDAETTEHVRFDAPEAFRAITYRAVRPEDYAEAAERLPWVQRAGAAFRWTGSWLTCFVTPDPRGSFRVQPEQREDLEAQLNRFRQAGREAYPRNPIFANLDLDITVCVSAGYYRGDVLERVLAVIAQFFSPDNFTFGTPLERSRLEAAIQSVPGVRAVERILYRRRGWFAWKIFSSLVFPVSPNEIIRVDNNPDFPERGSVRIRLEGGA